MTNAESHCEPRAPEQGLTIVHGNGDCAETLGINANVCLRLAGADPSVKVYLGEQVRGGAKAQG